MSWCKKAENSMQSGAKTRSEESFCEQDETQAIQLHCLKNGIGTKPLNTQSGNQCKINTPGIVPFGKV